MVTSVFISISVLLSLELRHYRMRSYTYYRNSIVDDWRIKIVTHASFTLHLNPWTTHVYLNIMDRNRITNLVDNALD